MEKLFFIQVFFLLTLFTFSQAQTAQNSTVTIELNTIRKENIRIDTSSISDVSSFLEFSFGKGDSLSSVNLSIQQPLLMLYDNVLFTRDGMKFIEDIFILKPKEHLRFKLDTANYELFDSGEDDKILNHTFRLRPYNSSDERTKYTSLLPFIELAKQDRKYNLNKLDSLLHSKNQHYYEELKPYLSTLIDYDYYQRLFYVGRLNPKQITTNKDLSNLETIFVSKTPLVKRYLSNLLLTWMLSGVNYGVSKTQKHVRYLDDMLANVNFLIEHKIDKSIAIPFILYRMEACSVKGSTNFKTAFQKLKIYAGNKYAEKIKEAEADFFIQKIKQPQDVWLSTVKGDTLNLVQMVKRIKKKYVFIDLWASWCAPCVAEIPYIQIQKKKYKSKDIAFVSISLDLPKNRDKWIDIMKKHQILEGEYQFILNDPQKNTLVQQLKIKTIPRFLLLQSDGKVLNADFFKPSSPNFEKELDKLLK